MTKDDLKIMDDDEFIELVKKYLPTYIIDKIYNDKLCKKDKRTYRSVIITLGLVLGIIPTAIAEEFLKQEVSLEFITTTILSGIVISYIVCNKSRKKEAMIIRKQFDNKLTELKNKIINLSDDEFNILVKCYNYIEDNELTDEVIESYNVLEITDELISINATNILKEFEESSEYNNSLTYLEHLNKGYSKTMNKND